MARWRRESGLPSVRTVPRAGPRGHFPPGFDPIRILIADDHPVVCFGIKAILRTQSNMVAVGEAHNGRDAVALFRKCRPDVTLMDLRMPVMGGIEAIRAIRQEDAASRIVVLADCLEDEEIRWALASGVQACVLKDMSHKELLEAIRAVHAGRQYLPRPVLQRLRGQPQGSALSPREVDILQLIGKAMNNAQIASALDLTVGTVKWHMNSILRKLDANDRTQALVAALKRDIVQI